jgi:hypothetical protein
MYYLFNHSWFTFHSFCFRFQGLYADCIPSEIENLFAFSPSLFGESSAFPFAARSRNYYDPRLRKKARLHDPMFYFGAQVC